MAEIIYEAPFMTEDEYGVGSHGSNDASPGPAAQDTRDEVMPISQATYNRFALHWNL